MINRDQDRLDNSDENNRFEELLAGSVLGDLNNIERDELASYAENDHSKLRDELELTAVIMDASLNKVHKVHGLNEKRLPAELESRILADAAEHFSSTKRRSEDNTASSSQSESDPANSQTQSKVNPPSAREVTAWLAFAASLVLALGLWLTRPGAGGFSNPSQARLALLSDAEDLIQTRWNDGTTPFEVPVQGDVVWSNLRQRGFMRFIGMPVNNPEFQQYQLWIIDPKRDDEPIDGGVFNISSSGEVIVPIQAKLEVLEPTAFAVTIEKPGGVVVSAQDRLPLIAAVE